MTFDRESLDNYLIKRKCVGFFDPAITLKSGRKGFYYINIRDAISTKEGLELVSKSAYDFTMDQGLKPDQFLGVPEGASPIAQEATKLIDYIPADKLHITVLRSKPKDHGEPKDKYSVGNLVPGSRAILLEDVSTTGGSGEPSIMSVQESGVLVQQFQSIASRLERRDDGRTVEQAYMDKYGIVVKSLTDITTLLPMAAKEFSPSRAVLENSENYAKRYCNVPVKLL